ncbi:DJ-1/PfpI family protein [Herminiimonas arsenitoxidans]|uniref:DJ-1/PfpI family protein n=1 Tax=Herminiimonas arsenitoxidans TaxID=1809410 RepID=UPI001E5C96AE|nr:DJ-1/PfpI family protein [Herminiimonas arsenitoxidans]
MDETRRKILQASGVASVLLTSVTARSLAQGVSKSRPIHVNIITVPDMVQLDITGPYEVLARTPGWTVDLVAATPEAVRTDRGLRLLPDVTRATARPSNILVVPGGTGIDTAMLDPEWLEYVRKESAKCDYVFGVCTGSLLLGAAGILKGKRAGGHWQSRDMLSQFGATVSNDRMTRDGNIYTSGGVTSGIDMALRVVADIAGLETAQKVQLAMEYDPAPPFAGGNPYTSPPEIVAAVLKDSTKRRALRESMVAEAAQRLNRSGG